MIAPTASFSRARWSASARRPPSSDGSVAVRLHDRGDSLVEVVRTLDASGIDVGELDLHAPSLDDVFLAKTGRRLEGARDGGDEDEVS